MARIETRMFITIRYVPKRSNPAIPDCAFNDYKFGLNNLNEYQTRTDLTLALSRYLSRDILYFIGQADTITDDGLTEWGMYSTEDGKRILFTDSL